jgi:hypothetical protein
MEDQSISGKLSTLIDIVFELVAPVHDLRGLAPTIDDKSMYLLLHSESEENVCPGKCVEAQVR